jgi:ATP-dependent exoDNAse (exonuclease V) beta subunit
MSSRITPTYLSEKNRHPRDEFISFDEGPHIYTVNGEQGYTSCTTFIHSLFPHFDAESVIETILKNPKMKDPNYKYYGMTKEQITESWKKNGELASGSGTTMHYDIECYYNNIDNGNDSIEFQYFRKFLADFPDLKPYRTEWCVYYEELKLSGSIDMVFENPDGTLLIYDWKRVKEISYENNFGNTAIASCIKYMPHTNFWHYSLQLNLYKTILEHKYNKKVVGLFLICLHPDNYMKTYERIEVPFLDKEINDLFEDRMEQLKKDKKIV